jgi:hypothetical protein
MRTENGFQKIGKERRPRLLLVSNQLINRAKELGMWKSRHYSDLVNIALHEFLAKMEGGVTPGERFMKD